MAAAGHPKDAWLFFAKPAGGSPARKRNIFWLDSKGDMRRAARRLFSTLRNLDAGEFRRIHVERPAGAGLAEALLDRLRRASSR
jgi:L-threonylcarbamoyladenylate synthase